jgi:hypothetical protein
LCWWLGIRQVLRAKGWMNRFYTVSILGQTQWGCPLLDEQQSWGTHRLGGLLIVQQPSHGETKAYPTQFRFRRPSKNALGLSRAYGSRSPAATAAWLVQRNDVLCARKPGGASCRLLHFPGNFLSFKRREAPVKGICGPAGECAQRDVDRGQRYRVCALRLHPPNAAHELLEHPDIRASNPSNQYRTMFFQISYMLSASSASSSSVIV